MHTYNAEKQKTMVNKKQIAAIEFGTSKLVTVVALSGGLVRCEIAGSGTVPYAGFKEGEWGDPEGLIDAVQDSITAAELEANTKINEIYVGVPGEYIHVRTAEAEIDFGEGHTFSPDDIDAVQDLAANKLHIAEEDTLVLHRSPAWFSIDDGKKTMSPMDQRGTRLRVSESFVLASHDFVEDIKNVMGRLGITIKGFLSPTLGASQLLLAPEERDRVAMLIDVGHLNTEICVIEGDAIIYHALLGVGGGNITAQLAYGFNLSMGEAEQIKRAYLFDPDEFDQDNFYEVTADDGGRLGFPRKDVSRIIEKQTTEICDYIEKTLLNDAGQYFGPRTQVYLTGGGLAMMRGGREYLAAHIGKPVKVPIAKSAKLNSPVYGTALGLVSLILDSMEQPDTHKESVLAKKIAGFLKRN